VLIVHLSIAVLQKPEKSITIVSFSRRQKMGPQYHLTTSRFFGRSENIRLSVR